MKRKKFRPPQSNIMQLRCYSCNFEFEQEVKVEDHLPDFICPSCGKKSIEINLGK